MNVIDQYESKEYGNDCVIHKSLAIIEFQGEYLIQSITIFEGSWVINGVDVEPYMIYCHTKENAIKEFERLKKYMGDERGAD